jgi:hypothetical protein
MVWDGVEAVKISGVDVWIFVVVFAGRVVCYVLRLAYEVIGISDVVFVIAAVPDLA